MALGLYSIFEYQKSPKLNIGMLFFSKDSFLVIRVCSTIHLGDEILQFSVLFIDMETIVMGEISQKEKMTDSE